MKRDTRSQKIAGGLAILLAMALVVLLLESVAGGARAARAGQLPAGLLTPTPLATAGSPASLEAPGSSNDQAQPGGTAQRTRDGEPGAPDISFIDSPTVQCIRPEQYNDVCYIQWLYLSVSASTNQYIISMTVSIDNRIRAYYSGFFQTAMYVPADMQSPGFRVACGLKGSGGIPTMGKAYSWVTRARETGGLTAANYGSVYCPADVVPPLHASLSGPATGITGHPYSFLVANALTTTLPITYAWTVTEQNPVTASNGVSNTQAFTWNTAGIKSLEVKVANAGGWVTDTHKITISKPSPTPTLKPTPTVIPTPTAQSHQYIPVIRKGAHQTGNIPSLWNSLEGIILSLLR